MDKWTAEQLKTMQMGGNENARNFFRDKGWVGVSAKVCVFVRGERVSLSLRSGFLVIGRGVELYREDFWVPLLRSSLSADR